MSKSIVQSYEGSIRHTFGLVHTFLEVCPDQVWGQKFGGWPVWQQLLHAFSSIDFFLRAENAPPEDAPFSPKVGSLKEISLAEAPAKPLLREYIEKVEARVAEYIAGLDDAALLRTNAGLTARMGRETNEAETLGLIACHTMYHLGSCDAALRENGLQGVF